jgi:hypothetical protein
MIWRYKSMQDHSDPGLRAEATIAAARRCHNALNSRDVDAFVAAMMGRHHRGEQYGD